MMFLNKNPILKTLLFAFISIAFLVSCTHREPKIFVIGDSISLFYGPYLQQDFSGKFIYDRKGGTGDAFKDLDNPTGANGGDSQMVLDYLKELHAKKDFKTDYFLINCGLHDIKHKSMDGPAQISLGDYKKTLEEIISLTRQMKAKMIWLNSTPVVDSIHNSRVPFFRFNKDVVAYNSAADSIMNHAHVPIIDLNTFTQKYIPEGYMDHVHYKEDVRKKQADFIMQNLEEIVK